MINQLYIDLEFLSIQTSSLTASKPITIGYGRNKRRLTNALKSWVQMDSNFQR